MGRFNRVDFEIKGMMLCGVVTYVQVEVILVELLLGIRNRGWDFLANYCVEL